VAATVDGCRAGTDCRRRSVVRPLPADGRRHFEYRPGVAELPQVRFGSTTFKVRVSTQNERRFVFTRWGGEEALPL